MSYVGKYMAKKGGAVPNDPPGRFWGVVGRDSIPVEYIDVPLSWEGYKRLRRIAAASAKRNGFNLRYRSAWQGFARYIDYTRGLQWLRVDAVPVVLPV